VREVTGLHICTSILSRGFDPSASAERTEFTVAVSEVYYQMKRYEEALSVLDSASQSRSIQNPQFETIEQDSLLVNLKPSGKYLMGDFFCAGVLPVVIKELKGYLHNEALTVNGKTNVKTTVCHFVTVRT